MHVFSRNIVNSCVFQEVVQNIVKYSMSDMLCCERATNSGVFASLALLAVAKTF